MEKVSEHQECPECGGVMMINYNPKIDIERDEQCFRCGYFHEVTIIREKNKPVSINDIPKGFEIGKFHGIFIEGMEEGTPIKDENDNYQIKEETYLGYGCYGLVGSDGLSTVFSTFNKPITSEKIAEFEEELKDPFYDTDKSFVAAWDSEKKEQNVLIGKQKSIPDTSRLSFKEWTVKMKKG